MRTIGIDEVGRGCWAGPLVAGAVMLAYPIDGLADSKQLTRRERERLSNLIYDSALAIGLGWVTPAEIDSNGLTWAVQTAMSRAMAAIQLTYDEVIIDGHINYLPHEPTARAIIKADATVPAVSAASIVAKVARDNYMRQLPARYQTYGFDKHVGYGTALHRTQLQLHGVSDLHRRSFKPVRRLLYG